MGETKEEDSLIEFRLDSEVSFVFTYSYKLLFAKGSSTGKQKPQTGR